MTCDICPYSLLCLGGRLERFQCCHCSRVIVEQCIAPNGGYCYSLIRCPPPQYELAGVVTWGCSVCMPAATWWRYVPPVADLSDL